MDTYLRTCIAAAVVFAVGTASWPSKGSAQLEVAPAIGLYHPVGEWRRLSDGGTGSTPTWRQLPAHLLAIRLTNWFSRRLALEGTFTYSPSQVAVQFDGRTQDVQSTVLMGSARALYKLVTVRDGDQERGGSTWDFLLGAGGGLVHRGGSAWSNTEGLTVPAFVGVFGVRAPLSRAVTWGINVEDYISWTQFNAGQANQMEARVQHDYYLSLSVSIRVAGKKHR
jgi:hypothetical protein